MSNRIIKQIIFLSLITFSMLSVSQNYDKNLLEQVTPTDPTSSSLGKYGVFPVNYSTGLVPISIPLYEIRSGDLSQTIELSYHGGGIRVTEEATWVGLGWDLNFGGVITRSMNGFPDELETSSLPNSGIITSMLNINNFDNLSYFELLANSPTSDRSFKPDLFQYNMGKYSGTFITSSSNKPISIAHAALDGSISSNTINLIAPDGTLYDFIGNETTTLTGSMVKNAPYVSGYYINSIKSANRTDSIIYTYQTDGRYQSNLNSVSQGYKKTFSSYENKTEFIPETSTTMFTQTVQSNKPQYIYFNGGRLIFNLSDRNDFNPGNSNKIKKLDNIIVQQYTNGEYNVIRCFQLYYSYFNQGGDYKLLRLCLDSIVEKPYLQSTERKLVASFDYYGNKILPNKEGFHFDYWGYYNGINNSSPIPYSTDAYFTYGSADKTPNPIYAQYGTIKSISYPTKGKTEFVWEGNRINSSTPIYNQPNLVPVTLYSETNTALDCSNALPDPTYDGNFSVTFHSFIDQWVTLNYYLYQDIDDNLTHNNYDTGSIQFNGNNILSSLNTGSTTKTINVYLHANHNYTVVLNTNCYNVKGGVWFNYSSYNPDTEKYNYPFAGLRIKEIKNFDNNGNLLTNKLFTYKDVNGNSSGFITNDRRLSYEKNSHFIGSKKTDNNNYIALNIDTHLYLSSLKSGLEANNYGYEYVQEYDITNGVNNGYTNYQFSTGVDHFYTDDIPLVSKNHTRGQLIKQTEYQNSANNYIKLKETQNYYSADTRVTAKKQGFVLTRNIDFGTVADLISALVSPSELYDAYNYEYTSDWIKLDSTITKEYFQSTTPVENKTIYSYGNEKHLQPTQVKSYLNSGDVKMTTTIYPNDDNSSVASDMVLKNMLVLPLDIKEYVLKNGFLQELVDGNKLTYTKDANNHILLTKVSSYLPNGTISDEFDYCYNASTRLIETTSKDAIKTSICWDVKNFNPVVIGKNISYSNLSSVLQTVNNNPAALYTSQDSRMQNTQINTFTYFPLIGLQSKTDARGLTTFYFYDNFGRLQFIKDNNGKILQSFNYNYKL